MVATLEQTRSNAPAPIERRTASFDGRRGAEGSAAVEEVLPELRLRRAKFSYTARSAYREPVGGLLARHAERGSVGHRTGCN